MNNHSQTAAIVYLKQKLCDSIGTLCSMPRVLTKDPDRCFTRKRKIAPEVLVKTLLTIGSKSLNNELIKSFGITDDLPTESAFIQQRAKLSTGAMPRLFDMFNDRCAEFSTGSLTFLACDGTSTNIPLDPSDHETYIVQPGTRGYNQAHINALQNVKSGEYVDMIIQGASKNNERAALCSMLDHLKAPSLSVIMADRGYESFNVFAHAIERKAFFLIRVKDIYSNGILYGRNLPDSEFDTTLTTVLTKEQTNEAKHNPKKYTILPSETTFDYFNDDVLYYEISFRIVRVRLDNGNYICLATNLDPDKFPPQKLKNLYHTRWNEETSFRQLKYIVGLSYYHSRKKDFIYQEIYAKMIMYNFCCRALSLIEIIQKKHCKYEYKANFSVAVTILQDFLRENGEASAVIKQITRNLIPIRPGRTAKRNVKQRFFIPYNYRPV